MRLIFAILLTFNAYANIWLLDTPSEITDWNNSIQIDQKDLIDLLYSETAWNYFAGDDGEECDGQIEEMVLTSTTGKKQITEFTIWQKGYVEQAHHCLFMYDLICDAKFTWNESVSKNFPQNWEFNLECNFE